MKKSQRLLSDSELKTLLDKYYHLYNTNRFIESDPVFIPHHFTKTEDIEISGLFAATLAWGQRPTIIKNGLKLMQWMDYDPYNFILQHSAADLTRFLNFAHRTFNGVDVLNFISGLNHIYNQEKSIGNLFYEYLKSDQNDLAGAIGYFRNKMIERFTHQRSKKHIANPLANASAKRLCMYLRWMVRKDKFGVDFGIWNLPSSVLRCPLDVHTARASRQLGLLSREQNDWKAVEILTENLKRFDADDPVKYDFALFGMSLNKDIY